MESSEPIRASSKTFCVLVAYTDPQKHHGHPRKLKRCGLLCSPMAKVELGAKYVKLSAILVSVVSSVLCALKKAKQTPTP
jgi:hypothetical protein